MAQIHANNENVNEFIAEINWGVMHFTCFTHASQQKYLLLNVENQNRASQRLNVIL